MAEFDVNAYIIQELEAFHTKLFNDIYQYVEEGKITCLDALKTIEDYYNDDDNACSNGLADLEADAQEEISEEDEDDLREQYGDDFVDKLMQETEQFIKENDDGNEYEDDDDGNEYEDEYEDEYEEEPKQKKRPLNFDDDD